MAVFFCITMGAEVGNASGISWVSFDNGVAMGEKQKKKVFVTFMANWCGYCKKMDREAFSNTEVINYINANFVPIKVDTDKEKALGMKYGVQGLPTHMFLSETGESLGTLPGYIETDKFLVVLKYIATDSYKTMKLQDFMASQKK